MTAGLADPTPDDVARNRTQRRWDESTRPRHRPPEDAEYTVQGKANAKELVAVHNHRREELSRHDLIGPLARFGFRR